MSVSSAVDDYSDFDAEEYVKTNFSSVEGSRGQKRVRLFILDSLHEIYSSGTIEGESLLDCGTGPVIHNLASAAPHFESIYLSDISKANRNALSRWLSKDNGAADFSHFFKYISDKDKEGSVSAEDMEEELRNKVKGILPCDLMHPNPLFQAIFPPFDAISSSFCLEVIPPYTVAAYQTAAENMASLIKPGGWVVLAGCFGARHYAFGQQKYRVIPITPEDVKKIWTDIGFTIEQWKECDWLESEKAINETSDFNGVFCMSAKKE